MTKESDGCVAGCVAFALTPLLWVYRGWAAALLWSWGLADLTGVTVPVSAWVLFFALKPLVYFKVGKQTEADWGWWYSVQIFLPAFSLGAAWVALWILGVAS